MTKSATSGPKVAAREATPTKAEKDLERNQDDFRVLLKAWYARHARELPWRGIHDPYATWLSEIMLQQTRVATVIGRYGEFLRRFPTLQHLAIAEESDVLALWSGLGYYRRARMLHRGAQFVVRELEGKLPATAVELKTLPGIGDYTAAAIASIAFGEGVAVVDGNVERVLLRVMGLPEEKTAAARARVARAAQMLVPDAGKRKGRGNPPGDHNQAMMELGATICLPRSPLCLQCPVFDLCRTRGEHKTEPREKQKSRIVAHLLSLRKAGTATEVLLERRPAEASLMAGMLELPMLPLDAVKDLEPVLRVRHAITNTNYYAQIFSEGAPAVSKKLDAEDLPESEFADEYEDELFVAEAEGGGDDGLVNLPSLTGQIPAAAKDLEWIPTRRLRDVPLTGLTRKVLQRLGVMQLPLVRID